jgi:hypothetical protein
VITSTKFSKTIIAISFACTSAVTLATTLNTNIIVNGDAEASAGAANFSTTAAPTGWTTTSNFTAVQYEASSPNSMNNADSAAVGGGLNYFAGGPSNATSSASQTIDISDLAATIDAGGLNYSFSGLVGGFSTQSDNIVLVIEFLNALSNSIGNAFTGGNLPRGGESSLLPTSVSGAVASGTRSVLIRMDAVRTGGSYNDGYADNLSLVLSGDIAPPPGVPVPAPLSLLGIGLLGWWGATRKSRA